MNTCTHASVPCGEDEIEISGRVALNRAFDGDVVAVERLDEEEEALHQRADKRLRREADDTEVGVDDAPSATAELIESAMSLAKSLGTTSARPKGRVVGIIKRNWREYCGTLRPPHQDRQDEFGAATFSKADRVFIPADARVANVIVQTRHSSNLDNKRIVVVLDGWDRYSHSPRGHWTTILGDVGDRNVESAVILHEHGVITREFSEAVLRCLPAADWTPSEEEVAKREDLRGMCACSIDPPGCKDIDDAVSCEELPNGNFRVGVHIADVTHFVHPDTAIDAEAAERCTTVYLVERRTDMLPGLLTTDLCSLVGGVERCCFTVLWEMTKDADIVSTHYCKAIIKSRAAMSYAEAQARIDDPRDDSELTRSIRQLLKLTQKIHQKRLDAGALVLASAEVKFELDSETQDPTDVAEYTQRETNKLIEEMMLLANQAVATKILETFPMFSVLRRHPPPKDEALKQLRKLLSTHDIDFKFGSNKELGESLDIAQKPGDPYFNHLVRTMATRCMNQAVYFCTGEVQPALYSHYGLAMERYTHFTSPIRRYADVLVHRLLAAAIGISPLPTSLQSKPAINEQCDKINIKHRMAQWASRASSDLHTFMFFNKRGAQSAQAVVTRVRRSGMQATVQRFGVEGIVAMPEEDWDVIEDDQIVRSRKDPSIQIGIFNWISVQIEADNTDFRNRTKMTFERVISAAEKEGFEETAEERRNVQKEMYPDRLVQEAN
jgi:exosome complex exonuclease DIS3/RRP44